MVNAKLTMGVTNMTIWAKRARKIKPYPTIPTEVKDYFLEPSDYVDDMAIVAVVSCAVGFGFIAGLLYGLVIGG